MTNKFYSIIPYLTDHGLNLSFFVAIKKYIIEHRIIRAHQGVHHFPVGFIVQSTSLQLLQRRETL